MRLGVGIELASAGGEVEVDGVTPCNAHEDERDRHGIPGADVVGDVAENDRADGATSNCGDEERGATLGVAAETAEGEREDDGEDAGFEEQDNHEHGETTPIRTGSATSVGADSSRDEDDDQALESQEDETGFTANVHPAGSSETTDSEECLGNGVEVCALDVGFDLVEIRARLLEVVDKVGSDTDLSGDVGELAVPQKRPYCLRRGLSL